ncbi:MAG: DUF1475 domain-containing protein [Bdellovibrionales bacterium]|jgi:hypothetical protein|nr:DUF1475 domain-containing protein [Bdellovibrionales bacterium]
MSKEFKIAGFFLLFLLMLGTTIWAGLQQNLFTEFGWSSSPMWFKATIVDFYINQIILWLWVCVLERKNLVKALWLILFICFGSMGTTAYIIIRLCRGQPLIKKLS